MNYYDTLGINKAATDSDIKQAYRKLAMANHPDRTGGDDTKFKQINEAYSILKDPVSRQQYDNPQAHHQQRQQRHPFEDMFSQFNFHQQNSRQPHNRDVNIDCRITFEELFTGKAINIQYRLPSGKIETLDAAVPPGVKNGDNVRFGGLGDDSFPLVPRGNLILNIRVSSHPKWTRENDNITTKHNVSIFDLILGTTIEVRTPAGRNFNLTVPKGTKSGTVFSITGQGIPNVISRRPGNVHVKVDSIVPRIQDETILQKLKDIKDEIDKLT